jgi:hypothetical protein
MKSATKILLSVFVFVFFSADLAAQHFSVKGKVADMAGKPLARASVLLLSVKDFFCRDLFFNGQFGTVPSPDRRHRS